MPVESLDFFNHSLPPDGTNVSRIIFSILICIKNVTLCKITSLYYDTRYRNSVGITVDENSGVFCLICMF